MPQKLLSPWPSLRNDAPQRRSGALAFGVFRSFTNSRLRDISLFLKINNKISGTARKPRISDSESEHVGREGGRHPSTTPHRFQLPSKTCSKTPMLTILADSCTQHLNKLTNKQRLLKAKALEEFSLAQMEKCTSAI